VRSWEGEALPLDGVPDGAMLAGLAERLKRRDRRSRDEALEELADRLNPTGSPGDLFLDWEGARGLVQRGFDIGSHTIFHSILSAEPEEDQRRDLTDSRRELEEKLHAPVRILAYPNGMPGDYDETTITSARRAGYAYAVTTQRGTNRRITSPFEVKRFMVDPSGGIRAIKGALKAVASGR
jgi:peptidoglycan/xylan/chitin deacetylase (PgdA/CDA1 family)